MHLSWQELRTVTLAQALERADTERTLVSQIEWDEATRQALAAARERGVQRVGVAEVVLERSAAVVARAAGRNAGVAALQQPGALLWLARGLPLLALLLGLLLDRIANAHRVDLLSPPLLAVLGWNLVIYAVLAWRARRSGSAPTALAAEAADIVIPGKRLERVLEAFLLIGVTRRRIRQNVALETKNARGQLLLAAIGRATQSGGQTTLYLTPMHGQANLLRPLIANIQAALQHVRAAAEQFKSADPWTFLLRYISNMIAPALPAFTTPAALQASG